MEITKDMIKMEIEAVPKDRLKELFHLVEDMISQGGKETISKNSKRILAHAGMWSDMQEEEYTSLKEGIRRTRDGLFTRNIDL